PLAKRVVKSICYGAVWGGVFASWGDLDIPQFALGDFLGGLLGMLCVFGVPAGLILAFLDSRRRKTLDGAAGIKVPSVIIGGSMFIAGLLAFPIVVNTLATSGSEWLTGGNESVFLRTAIGMLGGACLGPIVLGMLIATMRLRDWAFAKSVDEIEPDPAPDKPK
ncbi:MAG: hypothetical protein ABGZ35_12905, partial [Planctomycetaceae bacterium]